jgi:hypothetical protein
LVNKLRTGWLYCVLASLGLLPAYVHAQAQPQVRVEMTADRKELGMAENVAVRILVQAQGSGQPDIEVPEFEGFQVVQRSVQRPMQFSFGFGQAAPVVTSTTQYTFVLVPIAPGTFKLPPVRVTFGQRVFQSQALILKVTGQAQAPQQAAPQQPAAQSDQPATQDTPAPQASSDAAVFDQEAFLRTVIDKNEPYEGEQVTATIYLYTRHNLQQVPAIQTEASTDGFWVQDLLSPTRSLDPTRQIVNGHGFWVYTLRRFAGFALRAGELSIGSMKLNINRESVFDMFDPNRGPNNLTRSSVPVQLHVKALPTEHKPDGPVVVGSFEIQTSLDRKQVVTGDAVTFTAAVRGKGNLRGVKLADPVVKGLQILQPELRDLIESPDDRVQGTRSFAWLIVPEAPGTYVLPALTLETFDPQTHSYKRVTSDKLTLSAAGAARANAAATPNKTAPDEERADGEANERNETWPPLRPHSALARRETHLADRAFYPFLLWLFPLVWLGSLLLPAALARARARGGDSAERAALRDARRRLAEAEGALAASDARRFHADIAAALQTTLESRLGEPVSGLTQNQLRSKLVERGMPDKLSAALCELLAQCDFARFSSAAVSSSDMQGLLSRAQLVWSDVATFSPLHQAKDSAP